MYLKHIIETVIEDCIFFILTKICCEDYCVRAYALISNQKQNNAKNTWCDWKSWNCFGFRQAKQDMDCAISRNKPELLWVTVARVFVVQVLGLMLCTFLWPECTPCHLWFQHGMQTQTMSELQILCQTAKSCNRPMAMNWLRCFQWLLHFYQGRILLENGLTVGTPSVSITPEDIREIEWIVYEDHWISITFLWLQALLLRNASNCASFYSELNMLYCNILKHLRQDIKLSDQRHTECTVIPQPV